VRGSMRERSPGIWELRVFIGRDAAGKVRHKSSSFHGGKREAARALTRLLTECEQVTPVVAAPPQWGQRTTVNEAIEGWKQNGWQDLSPNTTRGYEGVWRRHVRHSIGLRQISSLTPYEVEQYFRSLKSQGCGQTTVRLVRALLHRSCRLACKWSGNQLTNPITDTELPAWNAAERPDRVRAPEPDEVRALLDTARFTDVRVAVLIRVVAATGMRRGEACALRWNDVDSNRNVVRIDEGVVSAEGSTAIRAPKTRASIRYVAVDTDTVAALGRLREEQDLLAAHCATAVTDSSFVFSFEPGGTRPPHPDWMSHAFAEVRNAASVASDVHLHSLRHFHATSVDGVISEAQKQSRLGWATVQMARHYTDAVPAEDRRAAEHIGHLLSGEHGLPTDRANDQPPVTRQHPSPVDRPRGGARQRVAAPANGRSA